MHSKKESSMKRYTSVLILSIIALAALIAALQEQDTALKEIPETITLDGGRRGPVVFPHVAHHKVIETCQTCHHNMPQDAERPDKGCRECHTNDHKVPTMKAFHDTCITCHRNENREKKNELPVRCTDCHTSK
jgi:hypothetical protein